MSVPSQESERSCICELEVSILSVSNDFSVGFWNRSDCVVLFVYHFVTYKAGNQDQKL